MQAHLQKMEEIITRSRRDEESFQIDTKSAVKNIFEYLTLNDLIKKPEKKKVEY